MRAVNLLPKDLPRPARKVNKVVLVGGASGTVVTLLLAAGFINTRANVQSKQTELSNLQTQLQALPKPKPVQPGTDFAGQRDQRLAAVSTLLAGRLAWDHVLREVSSVLPEDVWLKALTAQAPAAAAVATAPGTPPPAAPPAATDGAAAPTDFVLEGYTYSQEGVARVLARLALVPYLEGVELESSTAAEVDEQPVVEFKIAANLRRNGATS